MIDPNNPFADLESDMDAGAPAFRAQPVTGEYLADQSERSYRTGQQSNKQRVEVRCEKCGGSGVWRGGWSSGSCFACHGKGTILRAANYLVNKQKRAERAEQKRREERDAKAAAVCAWAEQNPAEWHWIITKRESFEFADAMHRALEQWGGLSPGQLAAVRKCIARDAERLQAQATQAAAPAVVGENSFPRIERLVRTDGKRLHLGPAKVVKFQSGGVGVVAPVFGQGIFGIIEQGGRLKRRAGMTDEIVAIMRDVEARGLEAVIEIGRATGTCCMCGRELTNEGSIEAGIGPICAGRMSGF